MTEAISSIMAFGYIFIVGFVFALVLIELLSFFAAGKITGSINDEFMSAFTLFGAMLFISMATGLVNAVLSILLTGFMIPAIVAFILYLGLSIFAVMRIYDLSGGKSFLFLIISFLITAVVTGLIAYGGFKLLPEGQLKLNTNTDFNMTDDANLESDFGTESESGVVSDTDIDAEANKLLEDTVTPDATSTGTETGTETGVGTETVTEVGTETGTATVTDTGTTETNSGPKLPSTPVAE